MDIRVLSAILFDADNTLFDFDRAQREALLESLELKSNHPQADEVIHHYKTINEECWKEHELGRMDKEKVKLLRFERLRELADFSPHPSKASHDFLEILSTKDYLLPGALETARELKSKGLKLALATNGFSQVQRGRLQNSPLRELLDGIFISEEMGVQKPDPDFFHFCLRELDVPIAESIMVGDSPSADIAGAKALGIFSIWINPSGSTYPGNLPGPDIEIPMVGELPRVLGIGI